MYKPMVIYNAIFSIKFIFNELNCFPKYKLFTLYILLMHVIEYYFYVNWNIVIEVWNISYQYYVSVVLVN
jgi:hypothetical protein